MSVGVINGKTLYSFQNCVLNCLYKDRIQVYNKVNWLDQLTSIFIKEQGERVINVQIKQH